MDKYKESEDTRELKSEIAEKVKTSTSTVSKIGQIIKYGKGGLEKVLDRKSKRGA